jgi:hypothetical protein
MPALRWDDISGGVAHIRRVVTFSVSGKPIVGHPKTDAGKCDMPIIPELHEVLSGRGEGYLIQGKSSDAPMCKSTFDHKWRVLQDDTTALAGATPNVLRYTSLKPLHRTGVDPATQSYLMGHEDYIITANCYTEIECEDIEEAREKMNGLLPMLSVATRKP